MSSDEITRELTLRIDKDTLNLIKERESSPLVPSILIVQGVDRGESFQISKSPLILGRGDTCDYVIRDDGISRVHAQIIKDIQGQYIIEDLESTNGLFLADKRIKRHVFREGDKILMGRRTILKFVLQDALDQDYQRQMYESAVKDGLTGIYNRKHFDERIHSELSFAKRHKTSLSILLFDLDHFKDLNDTYGHQMGDMVLTDVASCVSQTLREEDFFARYGGEEFVILARDIGETGAHALSERIRQIIQDKKFVTEEGIRVLVTMSIGTATLLSGKCITIEEMIRAADKNLYIAKENGRNKVVSSVF
jgi:two-component system, cell cycle response regulator